MLDSIDAGKLCHEMNTPLSVILLEMEMMAYCLDDREKLGKLIATAKQNSYRLARLIENLQDMLRMEAGELGIAPAELDVAAFVREICACAEPYASAKSIGLFCEAPERAIAMPVDAEKLGKVLFHLLSNAIKFTQRGEITVRIEEDRGRGIRLSVADTGEGIPEDALRRIFGGDSAGEKAGGLGLTVAKNLVEAMGGRIAAKSIVGEGSAFTIELPPARVLGENIRIYGFNLSERAKIELSDLKR